MYNMGFGDCFLLTLPSAQGRPRCILIDCGKHKLSTKGPKLAAIVPQVLSDVTYEDGPAIDLLIVTHRHEDHVSGFALPGWEGVRVGEVWMPWTEHPTDPEARRICEKQSTSASKAVNALAALALDPAEADYLLSYAGNNLTNAKAMNLLHGGFQGAPPRRFLPEPNAPEGEPIRLAALPGVEIYVLGPSRNPDVVRDMDPPSHEAYHFAGDTSANNDSLPPFGPEWRHTRATYPAGASIPEDFTEDTEKHIGEIFEEPALELLVALEKAVNGTSLILLFHIGRQWLLFPGDAQWGSWNEILANPRWQTLLKRLTFYKVGHHGSHNATPVSFVENYLNEDARVMIPTGEVKKWPMIPRPSLLTDLAAKNLRVARSDQEPAEPFQATLDANGDVLFIDTVLDI
jgi:beta-lactamase superfamily II metal-dependent hydrolase